MTLNRQRTDIYAGVFSALANPTRLEIVQLLCDGERTPSQLAEILQVSRPNLSQQLAALQRAGLVKRRREGVHVLYEVVDPRLKEACDLIQEIVGRELSGRVHALDTEVHDVPRNENALDRGVRAAVGSGLIVASVAFGLGSGKPMGVLSALGGAVLLFTAATGSCLLYRSRASIRPRSLTPGT